MPGNKAGAVAWSWSWDSLQEPGGHRQGDKKQGRSTGREPGSPRRRGQTRGGGGAAAPVASLSFPAQDSGRNGLGGLGVPRPPLRPSAGPSFVSTRGQRTRKAMPPGEAPPGHRGRGSGPMAHAGQDSAVRRRSSGPGSGTPGPAAGAPSPACPPMPQGPAGGGGTQVQPLSLESANSQLPGQCPQPLGGEAPCPHAVAGQTLPLGPHLRGSPRAAGLGSSTAGRRRPAASVPPHPPCTHRKMPLCAAHRPIVWHQHPGAGRAAPTTPSLVPPPAPRLGTRVFTLAHVCVPGHPRKARRDPGPPTTLAGDRVQPAPAHLPGHSCRDGNRQVTGWLKGSAGQPGPCPRGPAHGDLQPGHSDGPRRPRPAKDTS